MAVSGTVVQDLGGPGQMPAAYKRMWFVTAVVDPASVATQVTGTDTITVPGVALGDQVLSFALGVSEGNMTIRAYVSAANTVTLLYANNTAGPIDLASSTAKLVVASPAF